MSISFNLLLTIPLYFLKQVMLVMIIYNHSDLTYKRPNHPRYTYPDWGLAIGWSMAVFAILWIPLVAFYKIVRFICTGGRLTREVNLATVVFALFISHGSVTTKQLYW